MLRGSIVGGESRQLFFATIRACILYFLVAAACLSTATVIVMSLVHPLSLIYPWVEVPWWVDFAFVLIFITFGASVALCYFDRLEELWGDRRNLLQRTRHLLLWPRYVINNCVNIDDAEFYEVGDPLVPIYVKYFFYGFLLFILGFLTLLALKWFFLLAVPFFLWRYCRLGSRLEERLRKEHHMELFYGD